MMNLTLYVIQEELSGVVYEPIIYTKHHLADRKYMMLVREYYASELKRTKKTIDSYKQDKYYVARKGDQAKWVIRYWILESQNT